VTDGGDPAGGTEVLTEESLETERIYLGLRTNEGVELDASSLAIDGEMLDRWASMGWALRDRSRIRLTPQGWLRLDALATDLTALSSHS
jgi:oxygen-independent coproporphyrinogen-3 oxidase